ncbi:hypothetical protein [Pectinatus frisingensis]|uniref:hypothetical protein n=1 Tax=Pectinatus frisingensis TaxID=865 RepID=UPI0018C71247|nr:hypothetical protein [Pectinatus frisingensis]
MEILAGGMDKYFERTGIKATKTWEGEVIGGEVYQVWNMEQKEFEKLVDTTDESYKSDEWWRSADSSNKGTAAVEYILNGKKIKAWDGAKREDYDEEEDEIFEREYESLTRYFCDEIGCSQPRNVVALATDLAAQNGMTMAELFETYETKDPCEACHNALQCLVWSGEGMKAECDNWGYFEQNYVNGPKRAILDAELAEIKED